MMLGSSIEVHRHVVGFYEAEADLVAALVPFLSESMVNGGCSLVIADQVHRDMLASALRSHDVSVAEAERSGRYVALDARETLGAFMRDGRPDRERFAHALGSVVEDLSTRGAPFHAFGEMVALLWDDGDVQAAIELEALWNELATRDSLAVYCGYPLSLLHDSGDLVSARRICDEHASVASVGWGPAPSVSASADYVEHCFVPTPHAMHGVREFVRGTLRRWRLDRLVDDALVVACELATNAVRHAHSPFRVGLTRSASSLTIRVDDTDPQAPRPRTVSPDMIGGRGLPLVANIADGWGTETRADGKSVWARLASPA